MKEHTPCPYCGEAMSNPRRKQCGKPECERAHVNKWQREWQQKHKARTGESYRNRYDKGGYRDHVCESCGKGFRSRKNVQRFCSPECHDVWRREQARQRLLPVLHEKPSRHAMKLVRMDTRAEPREYVRLFVGGSCLRCGKLFVADAPSAEAKYCSAACLARAGRSRRRARKRQVEHQEYRRADIFVRDNWRCHLCGKKINPRLEPNHLMGATLDHIVPLARGGADASHNVAPAHRLCNSIKSDRGGGQTLLFG